MLRPCDHEAEPTVAALIFLYYLFFILLGACVYIKHFSNLGNRVVLPLKTRVWFLEASNQLEKICYYSRLPYAEAIIAINVEDK